MCLLRESIHCTVVFIIYTTSLTWFYWLCVVIFQLFEREKSENRVISRTENIGATDRSAMLIVSRVLSTVIIFYRKNVNRHVSGVYRSTMTVRPMFR